MPKIPALLFALILAAFGSAGANAQSYPTKPIRLIVPYLAGGGTDVTGRIIAEALTARLGQAVVVENKPGAGSLIGIDYVLKSPPDGYTLVYAAGDGTTVMSAVKKDMPYRVPDDIAFIGRAASAPYAIAVNATLPFSTFAEFVAYAKANPGKLKYGTAGVGIAAHLATVMLEKHAGIKMKLVVYKGNAQVVTDLIGGFIDVALIPPPTIFPHFESGKVKLLAQTGTTPHSLIPNVPTTAQVGLPALNVLTWYGIMGPAALPADILERLRKEVAGVLANSAVREKLSKFGLHADPLSGEEFRKFVVDELSNWKDLAQSEHIVFEE